MKLCVDCKYCVREPAPKMWEVVPGRLEYMCHGQVSPITGERCTPTLCFWARAKGGECGPDAVLYEAKDA